MTGADKLQVEIHHGRADVRLHRPDIRNAFDDELVALLHGAAERLGRDPQVRVVVLSGAGKVFCAGADLNWMRRMVEYSHEENVADARALSAMFRAWNELPRPVVGRIHGAAIGGGTGLVAVCDIAVAEADTVFAFSEVRLGILPAVIAPFVLARIGESPARDLFLTGDRFDAGRAREIGLVQRVAPTGELDGFVDAVVQSVLAGGPEGQAAAKTLIRDLRGADPDAATERTAAAIAAARAGAEGQEGMRAFLERRRAAWREDR